MKLFLIGSPLLLPTYATKAIETKIANAGEVSFLLIRLKIPLLAGWWNGPMTRKN
jgi:hypothetical protein